MKYVRASCFLLLSFASGAVAMEGRNLEQQPRLVSDPNRKKKPRRPVVRWVTKAKISTAPTLEQESSSKKEENLSWAQIVARNEAAKEKKTNQKE